MMGRGAGRRLGMAVALLPGLVLAVWAGRMVAGAWGARLQERLREELRAALAAALDAGGSVDVELRAGSPLGLWRGNVEYLRLSARRLRAGEVVADQVQVEGEGLQVDAGALARTGQLVVRSARRLQAQLVFTEQDLNAYLRSHYELARLLSVRLRPEGPRLVLQASVGDQAVTVAVDGRLMVHGERAVALVLDRLAIQGASAQELIFQLAGLQSPMVVELGELPVPVALERVETADGSVVAYARYRATPEPTGRREDG